MEIKEVKGKGRSAFTISNTPCIGDDGSSGDIESKGIKEGDIVIKELPYVYSVNYGDRNEHNICHHCLTFNEMTVNIFSRTNQYYYQNGCNTCKSVWYCSDICQQLDSVSHQLECSQYIRLDATKLFDNDCKSLMKMVIKILVKRYLELNSNSSNNIQILNGVSSLSIKDNNNNNNINNSEKEEIATPEFNKIISLEGNRDSFKTERVNDLLKVVKYIERGIPKNHQDMAIPSTLLLNLMCILECNTHELAYTVPVGKNNQQEQEYQYISIGSAIYYQSSFFNHSCQPNIGKINGKFGELVMIALRDIGAGKELNYNYIQLSLPKETRMAKLKEGYHFVCKCQSCSSNNTKTHDEFLSKYLCKNPKCNGVMIKVKDTTPIINIDNNNGEITNQESPIPQQNTKKQCNICLPFPIK